MLTWQGRFPGRSLAGLFASLGVAVTALADGRFSVPEAGQMLAAGSTVELRWTAGCLDRPAADEAELVLSIDGGLTFPMRITPEMAACAAAFDWRVPALPAAHARLALRAGSGEGSETETLELVSEEFAILAGPAQESEDLVRGSTEWWTRQALAGAGATDLFPASMGDAAERLVAPDFSPDISEPGSPGVEAPGLSSAGLPASGSRFGSVLLGVPPRRCNSSGPLRL